MCAPTRGDREFPSVYGFSTLGVSKSHVLARLLCGKRSHNATLPQQFSADVCLVSRFHGVAWVRLEVGGHGTPGTEKSYTAILLFGGGEDRKQGHKTLQVSAPASVIICD